MARPYHAVRVCLVYDEHIVSAWGRRPSRRAALLASVLVVSITMPAAAQPAPPPAPPPMPPGELAPAPGDEVGPEQALTQKIAVWRIDALGISPELVARLESLFRMELDRLAARALPTRLQIDKAIAGE